MISEDYEILGFFVNRGPRYKYDMYLKHKTLHNMPIKKVSFGGKKPDGTPYEQYRDTTPLGAYREYDHNNIHRRNNYRKRHEGEQHQKFSPGWASWTFLWS